MICVTWFCITRVCSAKTNSTGTLVPAISIGKVVVMSACSTPTKPPRCDVGDVREYGLCLVYEEIAIWSTARMHVIIAAKLRSYIGCSQGKQCILNGPLSLFGRSPFFGSTNCLLCLCLWNVPTAHAITLSLSWDINTFTTSLTDHHVDYRSRVLCQL